MQVRCAIVDDEPLALELLKSYVNKTSFLSLEGAFSNAVDALEAIKKGGIDLLFLDIQMPELNGMELGKLIREQSGSDGSSTHLPLIVFTTAFDKYAIDGYKVDAIGYLLKPISYKEFLEAASKAQKILDEEGAADSLYVKSEYKLLKLKFSDIIYIEGLKDYIKIFVKESKYPVLTLMGMKEVEEKLPGRSFLRVHRSFIINSNFVGSIEKGRIIMRGCPEDEARSIPIGDSYKTNLKEFINK